MDQLINEVVEKFGAHIENYRQSNPSTLNKYGLPKRIAFSFMFTTTLPLVMIHGAIISSLKTLFHDETMIVAIYKSKFTCLNLEIVVRNW
jgi:hypothetical protein